MARGGEASLEDNGCKQDVPWASEIPDEHWEVYHNAIAAANEAKVPFALGGAFALAAYTGQFRSTKDIDLYVTPSNRDRLIALLDAIGLKDIYDEQPYDRQWIHRTRGGTAIVDVIWAMANMNAEVDDDWLTRGRRISVHGELLRVLPPEELIWTKLYVLQRDRCDWPDVLNVLYATTHDLDWKYLFKRLADDRPLLEGAMSIFGWLFPKRTLSLPGWVRDTLGVTAAPGTNDPDLERIGKLDSRPWFRLELPEQTC